MAIKIEKLLTINESLPDSLLPWLTHRASLTEKLKLCSGDARLQVLKQVLSQPNWWDKHTLGIEEPVIHREIMMFSNQTPVRFARTIIPISSYETKRAFSDRLEHESLGAILFSEPDIERGALLHYAVNKDCLEYQWLPESFRKPDESLWLRFSMFTLAKIAPIYLIEILLPGLLKWDHILD